MKILTIANEKGGVGKTLIATQFALYCALKFKLKVCFLDLDQQGNASNFFRQKDIFKESKTKAADLMLGTKLDFNDCEDSDCILLAADDRLSLLEQQGLSAHNKFADNVLSALNAVDKNFDLVVIDTNPNPDIRSTVSLLACTHLVSPIQLNKEPIDGIARMFERIEKISSINSNLPNGFIGMLPNSIEVGKFQQNNGKELIDAFGKLLIKVTSYTPKAKLNAQGQVELIRDINNDVVIDESTSYAAIKRHAGIAEAQALGCPIWDMQGQALAWSEMKKAFFSIYSKLKIQRKIDLQEQHFDVLEECKSLYGVQGCKKLLKQFFMMDNTKVLFGLSLTKIQLLRELKSRISLNILE